MELQSLKKILSLIMKLKGYLRWMVAQSTDLKMVAMNDISQIVNLDFYNHQFGAPKADV
jgi:hypothetical protein